MCMLCLDTSLKAIHNVASELVAHLSNVYAMLDTSLKAIHNELNVEDQ